MIRITNRIHSPANVLIEFCRNSPKFYERLRVIRITNRIHSPTNVNFYERPYSNTEPRVVKSVTALRRTLCSSGTAIRCPLVGYRRGPYHETIGLKQRQAYFLTNGFRSQSTVFLGFVVRGRLCDDEMESQFTMPREIRVDQQDNLGLFCHQVLKNYCVEELPMSSVEHLQPHWIAYEST